MEFSRILRQPTTSEFFHNRKIIKIHNENISLCEIAISYVFCAFHIFYVVSDLNINIDSRKVFLNFHFFLFNFILFTLTALK